MTASVKTLAQARAYVKRVGICGIFAEVGGNSLWEVTDLPGRQPGQKGWGEKVTAVWTWKSNLPWKYPTEIFYGKVPGGNAALMTMVHLWKVHYPACHQPVEKCSLLAQRVYAKLKLDPLNSTQLRKELDLVEKAQKAKLDRALVELQTTLNIVRRHASVDERDTWVPFREQHIPPTK